MTCDYLKLENQLCFPVYAASRLITREYQPFLKELGITYPQYLVLLVLWEEDGMLVNTIAQKLILNTNTITPLLKRLEQQGFVKRERSMTDERKVIVNLTTNGKQLKEKAHVIPEDIAERILGTGIGLERLMILKDNLHSNISHLSN